MRKMPLADIDALRNIRSRLRTIPFSETVPGDAFLLYDTIYQRIEDKDIVVPRFGTANSIANAVDISCADGWSRFKDDLRVIPLELTDEPQPEAERPAYN